MRIVIFANGENPDINTMPSVVARANYIIAADGGILNCRQNNIQPDCIIGDFDSSGTRKIPENQKVQIIHIEEQNSTDMEKAIEHAKKFNPSVIDIYCSFGKRTDHSLGNIFILNNYKDLNINMHDEFGSMFALNPGVKEFRDLKNTTISLFALSKVENIELHGFEFPLKQESIGPSFFGVSNKISENNAAIRFEKGRLIVYQIRDESNK